MENIEIKENGSKVIITIDTSVQGRPSNSGKTMVIASSGGFKPVGNISINLSATKRR